MGTKLKVLTLNCWGVHVPLYGAKMRPERFAAIADELSKAEYDVILLQEVYSKSDYESLCAKVLTVLPYTHYFHSGFIGSGLCIFSKHLIMESQVFPFTLNGYAHKLYHGDWYANKAVGLIKVLANGIRVNIYNTHLHAEYKKKDEYLFHRVHQAFELSQVIKNTSEGCDVVIAGGDFNCTTDNIHYKLIRYNGNLKDSWLAQKRKVTNQDEGASCDRGDNCFSSDDNIKNKRPGARIDYLFYRNNTGYSIDCETCYVTMQKVPEKDFNFSDHDGVAAEFTIRKNITAMSPVRKSDMLEKHLLEAKEIMEMGINQVKSNQVFFAISAFVCFVALVFSADGSLLGCALGIIHPVLTIAIAIFAWTTVIISKIDISAMTAAKKDLENLIRSNPA